MDSGKKFSSIRESDGMRVKMFPMLLAPLKGALARRVSARAVTEGFGPLA